MNVLWSSELLGVCQASFLPDAHRFLFAPASASGCSSGCLSPAQYADVICHEYTHLVLADILGITGQGDETGALHEGTADYFSSSHLGNPCLGEGFTGKACFRDLNAFKRYPTDMDTSNEPHSSGGVWGSAMWALRTQIGAATADRMLIEGLRGLTPDVTFSQVAGNMVVGGSAYYLQFLDDNGWLNALRLIALAGNIGAIKKTFCDHGIAVPYGPFTDMTVTAGPGSNINQTVSAPSGQVVDKDRGCRGGFDILAATAGQLKYFQDNKGNLSGYTERSPTPASTSRSARRAAAAATPFRSPTGCTTRRRHRERHAGLQPAPRRGLRRRRAPARQGLPKARTAGDARGPALRHRLLRVALCARFFHGLEVGLPPEPWTSYVSFGAGASSQFAGLLPAVALVAAYAFILKVPVVTLFDLAAVPGCVAIAIGRVGCHLAGCCPGKRLPPGCDLPAWRSPWGTIPAPLLEMLAALAVAALLLRIPPGPGSGAKVLRLLRAPRGRPVQPAMDPHRRGVVGPADDDAGALAADDGGGGGALSRRHPQRGSTAAGNSSSGAASNRSHGSVRRTLCAQIAISRPIPPQARLTTAHGP